MNERRFNWVPKKLPWYWFITFWKDKWKIRNELKEIYPEEPGYESAQMKEVIIWNPSVFDMPVNDKYETERERESNER